MTTSPLTAQMVGDTTVIPNRETPTEETQSQWKIYAFKTLEVTKQIFLGLLGGMMCVTNPTLFVIGLAVSLIFDEETQKLIDKIVGIWETHKWGVVAGIGLFALTAVVSFLSLHVIWAAASTLYAINLGSKLALRAEAIRSGKEVEPFSFI